MVYQLESPDINTVINYCKDLCANDKIEVYDFGGNLRQYIKLTDTIKQKDVYSEMLETGIDIKMVRKYLGDDVADHMKDFCKEHGLI